jgi:serine/threonine protein kinase
LPAANQRWLLHAHHLIHRDIKPSNVIFVRGMAKLADIGLVTQVATEGRDVSYLGTEGYIPPEGPGTPAADVYSLGKVIYQAATGLHVGRFPELPSAIMEGTIDECFMNLNQIIVKACEVDPALSNGGELIRLWPISPKSEFARLEPPHARSPRPENPASGIHDIRKRARRIPTDTTELVESFEGP